MAAKDQTQAGNRRLVIVESQTKAKTIEGYLGAGYDVQASVGHIRDLPTPSELPAAEKKGRFGKFAVDVDADFEPFYVVDADKKKKVAELKRALKNADELFLATDEDREGEAIAWHLLQVLDPQVPVRRMVFHEITRDAIRAAVEQTRDLDLHLVDAQETRRILDRLYGYEVSPVLWRKVAAGPVGRSRAVGRDPAGRRAGARAHRVPRRRVLGHRGAPSTRPSGESQPFRCAARRGRRPPGRHRPRLRPRRPAGRAVRRRAARRGHGSRAGRCAARGGLRRPLGRGQALRTPAVGTVHDLDAAAGGQPQAADDRADRDAGRAAAVRERLHHLYAYRLHDAVGVGAERGARAGPRASTARSTCPTRRAATRAR